MSGISDAERRVVGINAAHGFAYAAVAAIVVWRLVPEGSRGNVWLAFMLLDFVSCVTYTIIRKKAWERERRG